MDTLFVAGTGAIGRGYLKLGTRFLRRFAKVLAVDKLPPIEVLPPQVEFLQLDVYSHDFEQLMEAATNQFVLVNACAGTDNLLLRKACARYGGIYLDACCSMISGSKEYRLSKLMPRTYTPVDSRDTPHMVCAGINPGMVEVVAKKLILEHFQGCRVRVGFFELDTINADMPTGKTAISWCADVVVEEIMLSPSMYIHNGDVIEQQDAPAAFVDALWENQTTPARIVPHEEIWNMKRIPQAEVVESFFAYSFGQPLMELLAGSAEDAQASLTLPGPDQPVFGTDTIIVLVEDVDTERRKALAWSCDHNDCFTRFGVNGVQFQTCSSMLFFSELVCDGKIQCQSPFCASDIDVASLHEDITGLWREYDIQWVNADNVAIELPARELSGLSKTT